jgi:hypothetical protein
VTDLAKFLGQSTYFQNKIKIKKNEKKMEKKEPNTHIVSSQHCNMERQELHGYNRQNALETVDRSRNLDGSFAQLGQLLVVFVANEQWVAAACCHLLIRVHALGLDWIVHDDHHNRHGWVDHGQRTVLELTSQNALSFAREEIR